MDYSSISATPDVYNACTVLVRMVDGIGFRLHAALKGITEDDLDARVCEDAMTFGQLLDHIWGLMFWVNGCLGSPAEIDKPESSMDMGAGIFQLCAHAQDQLSKMTNADLEAINVHGKPAWYLINGPLCDAVSHIGQLNLIRRANGNPTPPTRYFDAEIEEQTD